MFWNKRTMPSLDRLLLAMYEGASLFPKYNSYINFPSHPQFLSGKLPATSGSTRPLNCAATN